MGSSSAPDGDHLPFNALPDHAKEIGLVGGLLQLLGIFPMFPGYPRASHVYTAVMVLIVLATGVGWIYTVNNSRSGGIVVAMLGLINAAVLCNHGFLLHFARTTGLMRYVNHHQPAAVEEKTKRFFKRSGYVAVVVGLFGPASAALSMATQDLDKAFAAWFGALLAFGSVFWMWSLLLFFVLFNAVFHIIGYEWIELESKIHANSISAVDFVALHGHITRRVELANSQFGTLVIPYFFVFTATILAIVFDLSGRWSAAQTPEEITELSANIGFAVFIFGLLSCILLPAAIVSKLGNPSILKAVTGMCATASSDSAMREDGQHCHMVEVLSSSASESVEESQMQPVPNVQPWTQEDSILVTNYLLSSNTNFQILGVDITFSLVAKLYYSIATLSLVLFRLATGSDPSSPS